MATSVVVRRSPSPPEATQGRTSPVLTFTAGGCSMLTPNSEAWLEGETLGRHLERRGVNRRDFLGFCTRMAAVLGLSTIAVPKLARAMAALKRPSVIWLQLQECTGCVESVLRTADPTIGDLILDVVSLDYQHTIMAA